MSYTEELDKQLIEWKTLFKTEEFPAVHLTAHKITYLSNWRSVLSVFFF